MTFCSEKYHLFPLFSTRAGRKSNWDKNKRFFRSVSTNCCLKDGKKIKSLAQNFYFPPSFIFKKFSFQWSYFLIKILPHHFHLLLDSLIFREVDSKTEEMLWYSFFEGMQAKLSNENALYIDYLNKMNDVVVKVMFLSKNIFQLLFWLLIIKKIFSNCLMDVFI